VKKGLEMRMKGGRPAFRTPREVEAALVDLARLRRQVHQLEFRILKAWTDWLQAWRMDEEVRGYVQKSNPVSEKDGSRGDQQVRPPGCRDHQTE